MQNASSLVSVIVVNYNKAGYLRSCLQSIVLQTHHPLEIIVIDNGSNDASVNMVKHDFPSARLIKNDKNYYFGKAYNQGIHAAQGEWIFCLNNDIILEHDVIELLFKKRKVNSQIGMLGGKTLRMDKKTIDSTGLLLKRSRKPLDRGYAYEDQGQYEQEEYVFGIGGAAVLFRRKMLEEIQIDGEFFDEDFKVFYEDLDLCWRAHRFGWKAYYVPKAVIYHKRGATTKQDVARHGVFKKYSLPFLSPELQAYFVKNRYATIIKNDSFFQFLVNGFFILLHDFKLWGYLILFSPKALRIIFHERNVFKKSFQKRTKIKISLKHQRPNADKGCHE